MNYELNNPVYGQNENLLEELKEEDNESLVLSDSEIGSFLS